MSSLACVIVCTDTVYTDRKTTFDMVPEAHVCVSDTSAILYMRQAARTIFYPVFFFDGNWPLQFSFPINSHTHPASKAKTTSLPQSVNKYGNHKIKRQKHRWTENKAERWKTRRSVWGKCLWPPDQTLHQYSKPHQLLLIIFFHMHTSSYLIPLTTTVSSSFTCPHLKWFYRATLW